MKRMARTLSLALALAIGLLLPAQALAAAPEEVAPRKPLPETVTVTFKLGPAATFADGSTEYKQEIGVNRELDESKLPAITYKPGYKTADSTGANHVWEDEDNPEIVGNPFLFPYAGDYTLVLRYSYDDAYRVRFITDDMVRPQSVVEFRVPIAGSGKLKDVQGYALPKFTEYEGWTPSGQYQCIWPGQSTSSLTAEQLADTVITSDLIVRQDFLNTNTHFIQFGSYRDGELEGQDFFALDLRDGNPKTVSQAKGYKLPKVIPNEGYEFSHWELNRYEVKDPGKVMVYADTQSQLYFYAAYKKVTGWAKTKAGKWQYFNDSELVKARWVKDAGKWYYLGTDGIMKTGWQKIGSKWYFLEDSGAMREGWKKTNGKWYYLNEKSGAMVEGWKKVKGVWYYLRPGSGRMATGTVTIDGRKSKFASSGKWLGYVK